MSKFPTGRLLCGGAIFTLAMAVPHPSLRAQGTGNPPLRITVLALPKGEATLVQPPGGTASLIGGGAPGEGALVLKMLRQRGVRSLDATVVSSWKPNHVGGMREVLAAMRTKIVVVNLNPAMTAAGKAFMKYARKKDRGRSFGLHTPSPGEVTTVFYLPPCMIRTCAPTGPMLREFKNDVNSTMVQEFRYERHSFLDLGDVSERHLKRMRSTLYPKHQKVEGQMLRLGSTGLGKGVSEASLRALRTQVAVFAVPKRGSKPSEATLRLLRKVGARVYRTDRDGSVSVSMDGRNITVLKGR